MQFEVSKRLKELGVKHKSYFRWQVWHDPNTGKKRKELVMEGGYTFGGIYPAFSGAELGEMLPSGMSESYKLVRGGWMVSSHPYGKSKKTQEGNTEADARAKMLIYLLENKLIKAG